MDLLPVCNKKHAEYNKILTQLNFDKNINYKFNKGGKLIITLIEFRCLKEIEYVLSAILKIYKPSEIGLSIMYGNSNKNYIETTFKNWENIILIHKNFDNIDRRIYSALLKEPEFYENFKNWKSVLIYQTDALIFRKIDDIYFNYDYIGAPWTYSNQWCKYPAGNGGFSLRNVVSCIRVCEQFRKIPFSKIPTSNEDGFFCSQDSFEYPPLNTELHKAFSIERVKYKYPIGCHQVYHLHDMTKNEWDDFLNYMSDTLLRSKIFTIDTSKMLNDANKEKEEKDKKLVLIKSIDLPKIDEILNQDQRIGPFVLNYTHKAKNRWIINSDYDYDILFCNNNNPASVVKTKKINFNIESCLHKKESGCYYLNDEKNCYIIFYPGFPNGGECWADINAGGHFNHCKELPKNGAIILKAPSKKDYVKPININQYSISSINHNILAFDLFTGVGYYNQLFSLELAVYMATISNRYLILNINHPLVACGKPDKNYGLLLDYLDDEFKKNLVGFEVRAYKNFVNPVNNEQTLPNKISSCVIVDEELYKDNNMNDIKNFAHHRTIINGNKFNNMYNKKEKIVYFSKSNASRIFTNFYTTEKNYLLMNVIANSLSKYNSKLTTICKNIQKTIHKKYISIHLRMGDWHKEINKTTNQIIIENIKKWLDKNNSENLPIYIMTDKIENTLFKELEQWNIIFVENLITNEIIDELKKHFKNTTIAEFLIQKYIIERSHMFIGSQGSTVSTHIHYNKYKYDKSESLFTHSTGSNFNNETLSYDEVSNNKYSWKRTNLTGGHPLSWSIFTPDNILDIKDISNNISLSIDENVNSIENNSEPFVSIDIWLQHSDVVIDSVYKNGIKNYTYEKELSHAFSKIKVPIIFLKTDLLPYYIDTLIAIKNSFVLITASNDDHCPPYLTFPADEKIYKNLKNQTEHLLNNSKLNIWYSKNQAINHNKVKAVPIGPKWQWKTTKFCGENKSEHLRIYNQFGLEPEKSMHNKELKKNLLYFNFSQTTNNPLYQPHKNIRHKAKSELLKNGFKWNENESFENYIETLSTFKFCVAPPGRGIDTHRCWEALMVGTIPIVISSSLNELYENLPVIIVDSYEKVTEEFLNNKYDEMIKTSYKFEKIYSKYWLNKIKEH